MISRRLYTGGLCHLDLWCHTKVQLRWTSCGTFSESVWSPLQWQWPLHRLLLCISITLVWQNNGTNILLRVWPCCHTTGGYLNWLQSFVFHTNLTHRRIHSSNKSSASFSWEVEQPDAADRGRTGCNNSTAEITWFSWQNKDAGSYHHKLSWHLGCVCVINLPPNSLAGDPPLCSHIRFSWISTDFILGGPAGDIEQKLWSVSLRYLRSHMHLLRRKYGGTAVFSTCLKEAYD